MVKYCQECGNPSYDGATICGNCGAKFPPKSVENSKPPVFEEFSEKGGTETKTDFNFSKTVGGLKNLSKKIKEETSIKGKEESITSETIKIKDLSKKLNLNSKEKEDEEKDESLKPIYGGSVIGFKEKDKGIKDPAKKFKQIIPSTEKSKAEKEKEVKNKAPEDNEKLDKKSFELPNIDTSRVSFKFTKKKILIIAIVAIILAAILGASIGTMTQTTNETLYYSDGTISFYYPGNWSMYNNTEGSNGDIAFKTPDKVLIGYTTIEGNNISFDLINEEINQTATALGGSIVQSKDITINGIPATDVTISSADHGFSRYISIIHNNVYYSFVINNGKTSDVNNIDSLNSPDIEKMINSIKFSNLAQLDQTTEEQSY